MTSRPPDAVRPTGSALLYDQEAGALYRCAVMDGLTFQEIASQLGESLNTVASRYRCAIEKLRPRLGASRT
jgi:DNA-directed RNA polymerase specialized sigma24 family protein